MPDIAQLDEKTAVLEDFKPVAEVLPEFIMDCAATAKNDLRKLTGLDDSQRARNVAYVAKHVHGQGLEGLAAGGRLECGQIRLFSSLQRENIPSGASSCGRSGHARHAKGESYARG